MFQEAVFLLQFQEIRVAPFLLHHLIVEQSRLSEEERLHLENIVAVLSRRAERHVERPRLKRLRVHPEAKVTCHRDKTRALPVALRPCQQSVDA